MDMLGAAILSFIERLSSLRRLKCTSIIEKGPQSVSFIERFFLLCPPFRVSIIRGSTVFTLLEVLGVSLPPWVWSR